MQLHFRIRIEREHDQCLLETEKPFYHIVHRPQWLCRGRVAYTETICMINGKRLKIIVTKSAQHLLLNVSMEFF